MCMCVWYHFYVNGPPLQCWVWWPESVSLMTQWGEQETCPTHTHRLRPMRTYTYRLWMQINIQKWCVNKCTMVAIQTAAQRNWQGDNVERMTAEMKNKQDRRGRSRRVGVFFFYPLFNQVLSPRSTVSLSRKRPENPKVDPKRKFTSSSIPHSEKFTERYSTKRNCRVEDVRCIDLKTQVYGITSALNLGPFGENL